MCSTPEPRKLNRGNVKTSFKVYKYFYQGVSCNLIWNSCSVAAISTKIFYSFVRAKINYNGKIYLLHLWLYNIYRFYLCILRPLVPISVTTSWTTWEPWSWQTTVYVTSAFIRVFLTVSAQYLRTRSIFINILLKKIPKLPLCEFTTCKHNFKELFCTKKKLF